MIKGVENWRRELAIAERFREEEFGQYDKKKKSKVGYNIDYYEQGFSSQYGNSSSEVVGEWVVTTVNLIHALTKIILPSIIFQNPRVMTFPKKSESQDTAPIVQEILNHFYQQVDAEDINQKVAWDAYVLGYGVCKIGYATKYGMDVPTDEKKRSVTDRILESVGLKKPKPGEEETHPEVNYKIVSEKPYISYVSPFNFGIDPRATSIDDAMYVYEKFKKTVTSVKANKKYKNTKDLKGTDPDLPVSATQPISQTDLEEFKMVDLYEVHYRGEDGIYILVVSDDGEGWREHYHEKSIYEIDGWQYEILTFNKHGHKLYPISDITKIKSLQDRINSTIDTILEMVDRFVPKLAYVEGDVTQNGKLALEQGDVGALVACNKDPNVVFKELMMTQLKADLKALVDELINLISIQTGVTKTQLTGLSSNAETATEVNVEQGGQTLRLNDMARATNRYLKKQAIKLWEVIRQFVELEELQLINGVTGIDEQSGIPKYNWLTVDAIKGERMRFGEYDFDIEVGSTQKPDLSVIRKQFENIISIIARTDVIALAQQQNYKINVAELFKIGLRMFPEVIKDIGKVIQPITAETTGFVDPAALKGQGGDTAGSNFNALEAQAGQRVPTSSSLIP